MNENERKILDSCKHLLQNDVDPVTVSDKLFQCGFLSNNQRRNIFEISRTNRDRLMVWESLFVILPYSCNLPQFLHILLQSGYTEISLTISQKLCMSLTCSNQIRRFHRTPTGDSSQRFAQKLFMNFKINTHNNAFVNPRDYCHKESQKYRLQLDTYRGEEEEVIADKLAACLLAEIDSHIMLYSRKSPTNDLLKELKRLVPSTSNSNVTQLSYESRVGMTHALEGKEDAGEGHLQDALGMSFFVGRCVEFSNLLYIYVFNLLTLYENNPTRESRNKIIHIAELGIQSVEDEIDSIREFWFRLFTLRIIYCLLGLSYRGDPICGMRVDDKSIRRSKELLAALDRQWDRMESRRKIMYFVVKARLAELESASRDIDGVLHYLEQAIHIGSEGEYGETQFIKQYASQFQKLGNENNLLMNSATPRLLVSQPVEVLQRNIPGNNDNNDNGLNVENRDIDSIPASFGDMHSFKMLETGIKWSENDNTNLKILRPCIPQQYDDFSNLDTTELKKTGEIPSITPTPQAPKCIKTYGVVKVYVNNTGQDDHTDINQTDLKALNITMLPPEPQHTDLKITIDNETLPKTSFWNKKTDTKTDDTNPKLIINNTNCEKPFDETFQKLLHCNGT